MYTVYVELWRGTLTDEESLLKALPSGGDCWCNFSPLTCRQVCLQEVKHLCSLDVLVPYHFSHITLL